MCDESRAFALAKWGVVNFNSCLRETCHSFLDRRWQFAVYWDQPVKCMRRQDFDLASEKLANEMTGEDAESLSIQIESDDLAGMHFSVGVSIRNMLRHWGLAEPSDDLDDLWLDLLKSAVKRRLDPDFVPTPSSDSRDLKNEDWGAKELIERWGASVMIHEDVHHVRLFEFFADDCYAQFGGALTDDEEKFHMIELGLYERGETFISIRPVFREDVHLPSGGAPWVLPLSEDRQTFEFGDLIFVRGAV